MCVRAVCSTKPRQQVRSGICHAGVGSAPLTSLSSLDKDRHNLPSSLFLSAPPPIPCYSFTPLCLSLASSTSRLCVSTWVSLCFTATVVRDLISPACCFLRSLATLSPLSYLAWQVKATWELEWEVAGGGYGGFVRWDGGAELKGNVSASSHPLKPLCMILVMSPLAVHLPRVA